MENSPSRLGTEPIPKLLLKFSIPAVVGMLVQALYNVIDRIYVGQGVGEDALGGLSLCAPIMTIAMAIAMLFGMGGAALISVRLGQKKKGEANNALFHVFVLLIAAGVVTSVLGIIFLEPMLTLMGATAESAGTPFARDYLFIILLGQPFAMVGFGLSHCSRAQGFPVVTMIGLIIGAVLNTIVDPILIFGFGMGVRGAAIATIASQAAVFLWVFRFNISRKAAVRLVAKKFRPSLSLTLKICAFGSSQLLLQLAGSAVQLLYNQVMLKYGAELGAKGGDIALSALNIVISVETLILMPMYGINQGMQPIVGYNYGAKNWARMRSAYLRASLTAAAVGFVGMLACMLFPSEIVGLFTGEKTPELMHFAGYTLRLFNVCLPFIGFQANAAVMFNATARPRFSIFFSLLRQVIILIPCMLALGAGFGLFGAVWATPISDFACFAVTAVFVWRDMRRIKGEEPSPQFAINAEAL